MAISSKDTGILCHRIKRYTFTDQYIETYREAMRNDFRRLESWLICGAYKCQFTQNMKKDFIKLLYKSISTVTQMTNPKEFTQPVPSSSQADNMHSATKRPRKAKTPYKGSGKGKGKKSKKVYLCETCEKEYNIDEEWIECSDCNKWFHRHSASIADESEWQRLQEHNAERLCPSCT